MLGSREQSSGGGDKDQIRAQDAQRGFQPVKVIQVLPTVDQAAVGLAGSVLGHQPLGESIQLRPRAVQMVK